MTAPASTKRPQLLVSVRDATEARAALDGGADWIDLKEPDRGSLGTVDARVALGIVESVGAAVPLSAAAGELSEWDDGAGRRLGGVPLVAVLKVGLSGCRGKDWQADWRRVDAELIAAGKLLVSVAYVDAEQAESPPMDEVLSHAAATRARRLVLDTFDKRSGRFDDFVSGSQLDDLLIAARLTCVRVAVAGRLDAATIRTLPLADIDMIAVRGAACGGSRWDAVDATRVATLAEILRTSITAVSRGKSSGATKNS